MTEPAAEEVPLPLPHGHPSTHGRIGLRIAWEATAGTTPGTGGPVRRVRAAEAVIGAVHRGAEKLLEMRDYRQGAVLLDRHDWWGSFAGELGYVMAVELMASIPVPRRAVLLRTVLAELTRCQSHLAFLGGALAVASSPAAALARVRGGVSVVRDLMEEASGQRVHPMLCRVGGLAGDVPDGWADRVAAGLDVVSGAVAAARQHLDGVGAGLAVLTAGDARAYAVTGPVARASGRDVDLRRDEPYAAYPECFGPDDVVTSVAGDAAARFAVMAAEIEVAVAVVLRLLPRLEPGPVASRIPRTVRVPEGECLVRTETPQGAGGYYVVSRGGTSPHRAAIRSATFDTAAAWAAALPGTAEPDLGLAVASLPVLAGDTDR